MVSDDLFFWRSSSRRRKNYQNYGSKRSRPRRWSVFFFGNHAEAQADLAMAIAGNPNTVLMPGLAYSPNGPGTD